MLFKVGIYSLLRHIRCAHKINLLATSDFDDAIKNAPNNYYINFRQVFGKVTKLWNKLSRGNVACDIVHSKLGTRKLSFYYYVHVIVISTFILGRKLPTSYTTRWNST